jgi:hypothetical protein
MAEGTEPKVNDSKLIDLYRGEPFPAVVEIVRSLTIDDVETFADQVKLSAAGKTSFLPGVSKFTLLCPVTHRPNAVSLIWAARSGAPKALATLCLRDSVEDGLKVGDLVIIVHPDYRCRGLATLLLDKFLASYRIKLSGQLCMKDGADFLVAYFTKRGIPFRERLQTPEEFVDRCMTMAEARFGQQYGIVARPLVLEWVKATPQPHSGAQWKAFVRELLPIVDALGAFDAVRRRNSRK